MQSSGYRGGGGGFHGGHHHHHHHGGGGALLAGAMIGAAAASHRNRNQPQVVVVTQPAATTTGTPYYGSGSPGYVVQSQQPVVVTQPPPPPPQNTKKKSKLPMICCCLFIIVIIACMSSIPWPGETRKDLVPGSQTLVTLNGVFIEEVSVTSDSGTDTYMFYDKPGLGPLRYFANALAFPQAPFEFTSIRFDLFEGSSVSVSWVYTGCTLRFLVLDGESKYSSFIAGGNPTPYYSLNFNRPETLTINLQYTNQYYFVFDNSAISCYPTPTTAAFAISAKSYDTSNAFLHCNGDCVASVDYGKKVYMVLEPPTMNPQGNAYSVYYSTDGRWYSYTSLYVGLFVGMVLCFGVTSAVAKKKAEKDDAEDSQRLLAPEPPQTIHPVSPAPYQNAPAQPAAPQYPSYYSTPVQPTAPPADNPPPYVGNYPDMPQPSSGSAPYPGASAPYSGAPPSSPYPEQPKPDMKFDPQTGLPL